MFVNKRTGVNIEVMQTEGFTLYYEGFLRGYKKDIRDLSARCLKAQHLSRSKVHSQGKLHWCHQLTIKYQTLIQVLWMES